MLLFKLDIFSQNFSLSDLISNNSVNTFIGDYLEKHKDHVIKKLTEGSRKATIIADSFLDKARSAMGLNYR